MSQQPYRLPPKGIPKDDILAAMRALREKDVKWQDGRTFSLVYYAGEEILDMLKQAALLFFSENGLSPMAFPSLRELETQVVSMAASLLGGDGEVAGTMTSGGTESILMAVKTAREWARAHRPGVREPEMVLPLSAHPAFEKAAHYFGVKPVRTPLDADFRADVGAAKAAITDRTILLVGSAPSYPHGVVDPISELAAAARSQDILCHVDACVGGFVLPFVRRLGYPVPDFDFSVPGVTSISADLHKYGYGAKGASVILYRTRELRRHQFFAYIDWPGGVYASPTAAGTRAAGPIAAAWAVMNFLGEEGYLALTDTVMKTAHRIRQGIEATPGLRVLGQPDASMMAVAADGFSIYEVGDEMGLRGWHLDRQQFPPSLHMTVSPVHAGVVDAFLADLADCVAIAQKPSAAKLGNALTLRVARAAAVMLPERWMSRLTVMASRAMGGSGSEVIPQRSAAIYGMMGSLPNRGDLHEVVLDLLDQLMTPVAADPEE
jgi:sphinganine-1-phosphate aldolase